MNDIKLLPTGDWHSCGTTALHPNVIKVKGKYIPLSQTDGWKYKDNPRFYPSALQERMWKHFDKTLDAIAKQRKNKTLFMIGMGDMIDGDHHHTNQIITRHITEQANTNIELMKYTKERLGFTRGDTLAYLHGTDVHVGNEEENIAEQMGAYQYSNGFYCANFLDIELNGVRIWAYHKGVSAGQGTTRGNACINKLKQIYYECLQGGEPLPEWVISAHTHDYHHAIWVTPNGKTMHYVITPPWQDKTRFAYDNLATNKNRVGMVTIDITADGRSWINPPDLLASPLGDSIKM